MTNGGCRQIADQLCQEIVIEAMRAWGEAHAPGIGARVELGKSSDLVTMSIVETTEGSVSQVG